MRYLAAAGSCACLLLGASLLRAAAPAETAIVNRISDASFNHSEVVDIAAHLADQIGGRMTNSPAMRQAEKWTQQKFKGWGLRDVRTEAFDFGRGWWIEFSRVRMTAPRPLELRAIPIAWTPSTDGPLNAPVIAAPMASFSPASRSWRPISTSITDPGRSAASIPREILPQFPSFASGSPRSRA